MNEVKEKSIPNVLESNNNDVIIEEIEFIKSQFDECLTDKYMTEAISFLKSKDSLSKKKAIISLTDAVTYTKYHHGIVTVIRKLLLLDIVEDIRTNSKFVGYYNLRKTHPYIQLLESFPYNWREIFDEIQFIIFHPKFIISKISYPFLEPVFYFILCDPKTKLPELFRHDLWKLILANNNYTDNSKLRILSWTQNNLQTRNELSYMIKEAVKHYIEIKNYCILNAVTIYFSSIIYNLLKCDYDLTIFADLLFKSVTNSNDYSNCSVILMILAEMIQISPPNNLPDLLRLCKIILLKKSSNVLAVKSVISSLIPWLFHPVAINLKLTTYVELIIQLAENTKEYANLTNTLALNTAFEMIQYSDSNIDIFVNLCLMAEKSEEYLLKWLENICEMNNIAKNTELFTFISALFINEYNNNLITMKALEVLLKLTKKKISLSTKVLFLLFYKQKQEFHLETQIAIVKSIPQLAIEKKNVPIIIKFITSLKTTPNWKIISIDLYYQLWLIDPTYFVHLEPLLFDDEREFELDIFRFKILIEICSKRPELYGQQVVEFLKKEMDEYEFEGLMKILLLKLIIILINNDFVNPFKAWVAFSSFMDDFDEICFYKCLCDLIIVFADINISNEKEEKIYAEVVNIAWNQVAHSKYLENILSSLKVLSHFNLEKFTLKHLPALYQENLKVPEKLIKNDKTLAMKNPRDILTYIPGECWIQLLIHIKPDAINAAGDLLINWVQKELEGYGRSYFIAFQHEPKNYNNLSESSIIRALVEYICFADKPNSKHQFSESVLKQCLRILGHSYKTCLPSLDWSFLDNLFEKSNEIKYLCINLVSKQLSASTSSHTIINDFFIDFKLNIEKEEEIQLLFSCLKHVCVPMRLDNIKSIIINVLSAVYKKTFTSNSSEKLFISLIQHLNDAISSTNCHASCKTILYETIQLFYENVTEINNVFDYYVELILQIPSEYIEKLNYFSGKNQITKNNFDKVSKLGCALIKIDEKYFRVILNGIIFTAESIPSVRNKAIKYIYNTLRVPSTKPFLAEWLTAIICNISCTNEDTFLLDVYILICLILSGDYNVITLGESIFNSEEKYSLFPRAHFELITEKCSTELTEVLLFLRRVICSPNISMKYRISFYKAMKMLRNENAFKEKWIEYFPFA